MAAGSYINCHVVARSEAKTLAPYASAVSNLLIESGIASDKEQERPRNDIG